MTKLNPNKNFAQQFCCFDSFLVVMKYSKLLRFVITFIGISIASNSDFYYSKY